jgi:glucosamine--fructose-6-phosphate aminotransferase (isomerizing)
MTTDRTPEWSPDPHRFIADLEAKPAALERLATSAEVIDAVAAIPRRSEVLFLGMGSSRFAAEDAARRLRAAGFPAISEYASTTMVPPARPDLLVVAISASGKSRETLAAVERYRGAATTVALTEHRDSPLAAACELTIPLSAGPEAGGVACRSFQHTGLILRLLEAHLTERRLDFPGLVHKAAEGSADLLDRRATWLAVVAHALDGPDIVGIIAPAERWSSAAQSALMFREGPRRPAVGAETGDWNHVDVYLTRTMDYRALLLTGSASDDEAVDWLQRRGSTIVTLGPARPDVALGVRHTHSDEPAIAVHVDTLVAELVAAAIWAAGAGG